MAQAIASPSEEQPRSSPSPEDVLLALSALLGLTYLKEENRTLLQSNCPLEWSFVPWEPCSDSDHDQESPDIDFSSFPSLSLERSTGEQFESSQGNKSEVEAHVSSLLSRPLLFSNDALLSDDNQSDTLEFIVSKVSEVPGLMLQNFFNSFSTLMNSRLRAYATFLARHGLTLLETSSTSSELDEGVVGVEQKLETMLEIGRLVSTNAIVTSFQANKDGATRTEASDGICQVCMPLVMDAAIDISLPRPWGGSSEVVTVSFRTSGSITGIFSNESSSCLLRVVGVDLDMSTLLPCMIEEAASVISCIVEMTNAVYSLSLPLGIDEAQGVASFNKIPPSQISPRAGMKRKGNAGVNLVEPDTAVVSPSLHPTSTGDMERMPELSLGDSGSTKLSAEHLVDFILNETDDSILSPPSGKKAKIVPASDMAVMPALG